MRSIKFVEHVDKDGYDVCVFGKPYQKLGEITRTMYFDKPYAATFHPHGTSIWKQKSFFSLSDAKKFIQQCCREHKGKEHE